MQPGVFEELDTIDEGKLLTLKCKHCGYIFCMAEKDRDLGTGFFKPICPNCGIKSIFDIDNLPKCVYSVFELVPEPVRP